MVVTFGLKNNHLTWTINVHAKGVVKLKTWNLFQLNFSRRIIADIDRRFNNFTTIVFFDINFCLVTVCMRCCASGYMNYWIKIDICIQNCRAKKYIFNLIARILSNVTNGVSVETPTYINEWLQNFNLCVAWPPIRFRKL